MATRTFSNIHIIFLSMLELLVLFKSHPHFYIQRKKSYGVYFIVVLYYLLITDNCLFRLSGWRPNEDNH